MVPDQHDTGPTALAGTVLADRYAIDALIGEGGMARVYRAEDRLLGRTVALKVLRSDAATGTDLQRQQEEIRLLAAMQHPSLVTLFDVVSDGTAEERAVLVMQYVEGENLRDALSAGGLGSAQTAAIGADVAGALAYIHARGVVHRDVKPANILLTDGVGMPAAMLSDFGIARLVDAAGPTLTGNVIGTAHYLSPEQARGGPVAPATDVYALGLVLIECLTGERSFPGTALESAAARMTRDPELPDGLQPGLRDVLAAMTARDPRDRPSAERAADALRAIADDATLALPAAEPPATTTEYAPTAAMPRPGHPRARIVALAAAAGIAAVLLGWWAIDALPDPAPPQTVQYTPVDGRLGEYLQRLQEAVAP